VFTPTEYGFAFEAPTRFDKLFSGVASPRPAWLKPLEPGHPHLANIETTDTEIDYGRLLERAERRLRGEHIGADSGAGKGKRPQQEATASRVEEDGIYMRVEGWLAA
jgi:hypothetical protein